MTASNTTPAPFSPARRRARRLRITAVIVLLAGILGEGVVYWRGAAPPDWPDDPSLVGYDKAQARQIGILYGKQGLMVENWANDLKKPGTQALLIVVTAALVAGGCLYVARLLDSED
jgi:hypothetical protein